MTFNVKIFTLILIVLIAFTIRLYLILTQDPAGDEIWSLYLIQNNYKEIWFGALADHNGPLHFLLVHMLSYVLNIPVSVQLLRAISLVFGTAVSIAIYFLSLMLLNKRTAITALLLSLFLPSFVWISVFGRYYAFLAFLIIAILFLIVQYQKKKENKYLLLYVVSSTLGLYTHFYFVFVVFSISFFFLIDKTFRHNYKNLIIAFISIVILAFPLFYSFINAPKWQNMVIRNYLIKIPAVPISNISSTQTLIFLQHNPGAFYIAVFTLLFASAMALFYFGIIDIKNKSIKRLFLLLMIIPILGAIVISYIILPMFSTNAFLILLPVQTIILACGIAHFWKERIYAVTVFIVFVGITYIPFFQSFKINKDFAKPFRFVKEKLEKDDITVHTNIYLFIGTRYYLGDGIHFALIPSITNQVTETTHGYKPVLLKDIPLTKRVWYFEPWFYNIEPAKQAKKQLDAAFRLVFKKTFVNNGVNVYLYERR